MAVTRPGRWLAIVAGLAPALVATGARAGEGMPQLNFANPLLLAQVVWLAIIFTLLYVLLSRWALPKVADVLEFRAATIGADLDAARQAKGAADAAVVELTRATKDAQAGAQGQIAQAVASAKAAADARGAALNATLEAQIAAAEQRIAAARSAAMGALEQVANDATRAVVARLTGTAIPTAAVDRAVADALAARPR